jgi:hypothetical protein
MAMDGGEGPTPVTSRHIKVIPRWLKLPPRVDSGHPGRESPLHEDREHPGAPPGTSGMGPTCYPPPSSPHLTGFSAVTVGRRPRLGRAFTPMEEYSIGLRSAINRKGLTYVIKRLDPDLG